MACPPFNKISFSLNFPLLKRGYFIDTRNISQGETTHSRNESLTARPFFAKERDMKACKK
jgi:hypothetical protein